MVRVSLDFGSRNPWDANDGGASGGDCYRYHILGTGLSSSIDWSIRHLLQTDISFSGSGRDKWRAPLPLVQRAL